VRCDQERPDVSCRRCAKAGRPWYVDILLMKSKNWM
jgi:hypothetical protein